MFVCTLHPAVAPTDCFDGISTASSQYMLKWFRCFVLPVEYIFRSIDVLINCLKLTVMVCVCVCVCVFVCVWACAQSCQADIFYRSSTRSGSTTSDSSVEPLSTKEPTFPTCGFVNTCYFVSFIFCFQFTCLSACCAVTANRPDYLQQNDREEGWTDGEEHLTYEKVLISWEWVDCW